MCALILVHELSKRAVLNAEAARWLAVPELEASHYPTSRLPANLQQVIAEAWQLGAPISRNAFKLRVADGEINLALTAVLAPALEKSRWLAIALTASSSTPLPEAKLRELHHLAQIGTLSASLTHDIKNALVAISTFVEVTSAQGADQELTALVRREIQRINALVGQLLRFATPLPIQFQPLRMHDLLARLLRLLQHHFSEKEISETRVFQAGNDLVRGDSMQLEQVFMNLFLNAVSAMKSGGSLTIATANQADGRLNVTVADTGCGIPPQVMARLFEPFLSTKPEGTGLGLSIARRIIHEHGGEITAQNAAKQGAQFHITLPVLPPPGV